MRLRTEWICLTSCALEMTFAKIESLKQRAWLKALESLGLSIMIVIRLQRFQKDKNWGISSSRKCRKDVNMHPRIKYKNKLLHLMEESPELFTQVICYSSIRWIETKRRKVLDYRMLSPMKHFNPWKLKHQTYSKIRMKRKDKEFTNSQALTTYGLSNS